jgi:beta-glucosidase
MTLTSGDEHGPALEPIHSAAPQRLNRREVLRGVAANGSLLLGGSLLFGSNTGESNKKSAATSVAQIAGRSYRFPDGFLWGAGTSGLQHEGSPLADGAGESAMYRWAHEGVKKRVAQPDWFTPPIETFDVSADFYRRYRSDIQLMRQMNLRAYNFEVYWPRILPEGTGRVNEAGLDFYDRLVDEFLKADIAPLCNLYVFDHPAVLEERGGWLNRDMAEWFADYAAVLYKRLGDRVPYWSTICEIPIIVAFTSGAIGPKRSATEHLRATHHLLLGQGRAVQAFRASGARGQIGNQHNWHYIRPASDKEEDIAATRRANSHSNLLYLDSQLRGEYPKDLIELYGAKWPTDAIKEGDLATVSTRIDFIGLDYYHQQVVRHDPQGGELQIQTLREHGGAEGIYQALTQLRERYGETPVFVLEIGHAVEDTVKNGQVDDPERLECIRDVLTGLHRAIRAGVDVRGCFVWSLFDGWEFGWGLSRRYGLVHVDFETQQRMVKASGRWYRDMIGANGFDVANAVSTATV